MKKKNWLPDVNYEVKDHRPELWIWGIDDDGKRILIIDRNFLAYFYLVIEEKEKPEIVIERIQSSKADLPLLVKLEHMKRKLLGKPVNAIRVSCKDTDLISKCMKPLSKIKGVRKSVEDDIRYSMRYTIDNDVPPCDWYEIEVEETKNRLGIQVDSVYSAKSFPHSIEKTEVPQLRILGFSTICYSQKGMPKPEKNPFVVVSVAANTGDKRHFMAQNPNDRHIIESFVKYVRMFDPDVIVGYGTNRQD